MLKRFIILLLLSYSTQVIAQQKLGKLTVEKIMRDPKWIGSSPSNPYWSLDGNKLYFNWNPNNAPDDSLYFITKDNQTPVKATVEQKLNILTENSVIWNRSHTAYVYSKNGDVFLAYLNGTTKQITQTVDAETNPGFSFNESKIVYTANQNLFAWDISTGETIQLTNLRRSVSESSTQPEGLQRGGGGRNENFGGGFRNQSPVTKEATTPEEQWLKKEQMEYFEVLKSRKEKREATQAYEKSLPKKDELRAINIGDHILQGLNLSPDGRFVSYRLITQATNAKATIIPSYVTESGYTVDLPGRPKVGSPQSSSEFYIYDREKDKVHEVKTDQIPGIKDLPDYVKDYPSMLEKLSKNPENRPVTFFGPYWSPKGTHAVLEIFSQDNKDRWLMLWDTASGKLKLLDRQRDEAWIGGPGIQGFGRRSTGWIDENTFWYQSEATGYSHLYSVNVESGVKKALTSGKYEVQEAQLSDNKKYFYITTNEVHPGEKQFYRLPVEGGKAERITTMTGANEVAISPDEKWLAVRYSYSNKPWELYLQENKPGSKAIQITNKAQSEEFNSYPWRDPQVITFMARDGAQVYARLYKPAHAAKGKPAVLFVHGAGYLQNAHKWWSDYFREYMFNNMLADNGYYVLDIDYRGSAGYGRDWRTAIYRHMGGKDLDDNVDGANYLVKTFGVNPKHLGLYGGSYGGFLTLMAMFTTPDKFIAGAALRPVTDWANYNHGYTSNILNEPYNDSLAYKRSSPYYFANGLKNHLLICHGMMDLNVHFQDAVKLSQRLIELGKDNWELAPYPMENHGFTEPSSWTDEYKRIYKLFETELKK
ncbi:MAG: prolyl oligopeptidase family serine peptidase [Bacteroidetes bacterium]|nr:prolyl oligopeptidase family serine peptidase [Bacteroidota bacterium]MBS1930687.1 prolyl oligopeptidase family serine peptidase [Bacteroidota bacterium]